MILFFQNEEAPYGSIPEDTQFCKIYDEMGGPDDEEEDHTIARTWVAYKKVTEQSSSPYQSSPLSGPCFPNVKQALRSLH